MIPVLYSPTETAFTSQGLGTLNDVISCTVTEKRNGSFELQMEYGVEGIHYSDLAHSCQILAKPNEGMDPQPFRIYRISKPLNGKVTVYAEHISYQLSHIPVSPFTETSVSAVFSSFESEALESCPFTFWTDKTDVGEFKVEKPASIRSLMGDQAGSVLKVYGGEYQFDGYTVRLYNERGRDNGVVLRYGKNITDLNQDENIANTITGIVPFWKKNQDDPAVMLNPPVVYSSNASAYPYKRTVPVDFSSDFEEQPTQSELRTAAENYISNNNIGIPEISLKVSFVALWQTEEYKNIIGIERVNLCDTVTVEFPPLGVNAKAKVISTTYDVLLERYTSIELGEAKSNLASTVAQVRDEIVEQTSDATKTYLQQSIDRATQLITGGLGGYVVTVLNADDQPQELLILGDDDDYTVAQQVWRWNRNGLGYSSTGYNGTYSTAITKDGHIVADFIDTGTLTANVIKVGVLQDFANLNRWNMQTGDFRLAANNGSDDGITLTSGVLTINATYITTGFLSANRIKGGTLELGGLNNISGRLAMKDSSDSEYGHWDTGGFAIGNNFSVTPAGLLTATGGANITGLFTSTRDSTTKVVIDSARIDGYVGNTVTGSLDLVALLSDNKRHVTLTSQNDIQFYTGSNGLFAIVNGSAGSIVSAEFSASGIGLYRTITSNMTIGKSGANRNLTVNGNVTINGDIDANGGSITGEISNGLTTGYVAVCGFGTKLCFWLDSSNKLFVTKDNGANWVQIN